MTQLTMVVLGEPTARGSLSDKRCHRMGDTVISVVSMGGPGKTMLVRKVYENQLFTNHFNNQAWITEL